MDARDTLSQHLREYLKDMDRDYIEETVPPEEREEDAKLRKYFKELTREILGAIESIKPPAI